MYGGEANKTEGQGLLEVTIAATNTTTDTTTGPAIKNNDHRYVRQLNLVLRLMYERYFFHIYRIYALQCFCSD